MEYPIVGGAYTGRSDRASVQDCINLMVEKGAEGEYLINTPGLVELADAPSIAYTNITNPAAGKGRVTTASNHQLTTGDYITVTGSTDTEYDATRRQIQAVTATTFDYNLDNSGYSSGGTETDSTIRHTSEVRGMQAIGESASVTDYAVYYVVGSRLYKIAPVTPSVTWQSGDGLNTASGIVSMTDNGGESAGGELVIADGADLWVYDFGATTWASPVTSNPTDPNTCTFVDGRIVVDDQGNPGRFYYSDLYDASTINAFAFATAEGSPDALLGVFADRRELFLLGARTVEVWYNAGSGNNPFQRFQGGFSHIGIQAVHSVARLDRSIVFLARSERGDAMVVRLGKGYQPEVISPPALNYTWSRLPVAKLEGATGYSYQLGGHEVYVLTIDTRTWCYDAVTKNWHQWSTGDGSVRHRGNCHAHAYGLNIIGDYENGKLYYLDEEVYQDNGTSVTRQRTSYHLFDEQNRVRVASFEADMETDVGNANDTSPEITLEWSKDGGSTFNGTAKEIDTTSSSGGNQRAIWYKVGVARDWVFRLKTTAPVKIRIRRAWLRLFGE